MKLIGYLICASAVMVIGLIIMYPVVNWVTDHNGFNAETVVNMFPFVLLIGVPLIFIGFYVVGKGDEVYVDFDDDSDYAVSEKYEYERKRLTAEEKLKGKYADGVVTDMEYTKKMSRL